MIEVLDEEEQEFDIEKIDFHEEFGVGPYLNNDIAVVHINRKSGGIKFGNKVGPACLPPKDLVLNPAINLTVSGWGKNGYDAAQRQGGTNFVSKLNMAVVPVIERSACKEEKVYGPEKISLGMFCAGHFEKCLKNIANENLPDLGVGILLVCGFALILPFCPLALISHKDLPSYFALALAINVA